MKLIRLKVGVQFRSLQSGFEINFRSSDVADSLDENLSHFNPFCFAGLNGSGKSNVLEALAEIFFHLDSCALKYKPEKFESSFNPSLARLDAFELDYLIGLNNQKVYNIYNFYLVKISKVKGEVPQMQVKGYPFDEEEKFTPVSVVSSNYEIAPSKIYFPDLIVAYSSGENEILSLPFIKTQFIHYDEYIEAVERSLFYEEPESGLIYIDKGMSQAVLLSNMLFQDELTLLPLKEALGITEMRSFRINLNMHNVKIGVSENYSLGILEQLADRINLLKKCSSSWFSYTNQDGIEQIVLDFWVNDATKKAFKEHFHNAFKLFRLFQVLYVLNNRTATNKIKQDVYQSKGYYLDGKIPHPAPAEHVFYFLDFLILKQSKGDPVPKELLLRNFSDGEHQFLHTIGICLMLKNHRTLLLLDEPETHFNPSWRSKFIKILRDSIKAGGGNNLLKEIVLTSHSPFLISDSQPEYVFVFTKDDYGSANVQTASQLGLNTFGTSINLISMKIFGKTETIADLPNEIIINIKRDLKLEKINKAQAIDMAEELGESIEKTLLMFDINSK